MITAASEFASKPRALPMDLDEPGSLVQVLTLQQRCLLLTACRVCLESAPSALTEWAGKESSKHPERLCRNAAKSALQDMPSSGLAGMAEFVQEAALLSGDESAMDAPGVRLLTLHAAKGLEFDTVFIAGAHLTMSREPARRPLSGLEDASCKSAPASQGGLNCGRPVVVFLGWSREEEETRSSSRLP